MLMLIAQCCTWSDDEHIINVLLLLALHLALKHVVTGLPPEL